MFEFSQFKDGNVVVSSNDPPGMEGDLVFATGCIFGDPRLDKQIALAKFIVEACNMFLVQKTSEDKKLLNALKHREISLMSYRIDMINYPEKVVEIDILLSALRKNISKREAAELRVHSKDKDEEQ